jgi:hypothetical protein
MSPEAFREGLWEGTTSGVPQKRTLQFALAGEGRCLHLPPTLGSGDLRAAFACEFLAFSLGGRSSRLCRDRLMGRSSLGSAFSLEGRGFSSDINVRKKLGLQPLRNPLAPDFFFPHA